jgi:hypothetical protein
VTRGVQGENQVGDAVANAIGEALKVKSGVQDLDLVRLFLFIYFVNVLELLCCFL